MTSKLFFEAILKFLLGIVLVGVLVFLPAGTFNYFNGWLFMGFLFIPIFIAGIVMMVRNPQLLASRLDIKEKQKEQGILIKLSGLMFMIGFILAGFDFRFQWIQVSPIVSYIASGVLVLAYILWAEVLRENKYLSRTIKVEDGQTLIDTGLYGVVRHPMYLASIILFLMMPLVLGSIVSFFVFLFYPIIIVFRIVNEEKVLEKELKGYIEYKKKVKYRLIPFIW